MDCDLAFDENMSLPLALEKNHNIPLWVFIYLVMNFTDMNGQ